MPNTPLVTNARISAAQFGGCNTYHVVSLATNNAAVIKSAPGTVYGWSIGNSNGSPRYVKLYNKTTTPVPNTDTTLHSIILPGNSNGSGTNFCFTPGINFTVGIAIATVANPSDTDNTPIGANDLVISIFYQ